MASALEANLLAGLAVAITLVALALAIVALLTQRRMGAGPWGWLAVGFTALAAMGALTTRTLIVDGVEALVLGQFTLLVVAILGFYGGLVRR